MAKINISTVLDCLLCGPCGKWKDQIQDDDADLFNDHTLAFPVPDMKSPAIPKVVDASDSDTDEDISTLYESFNQRQYYNWNRTDEGDETKSSPSLTTPRQTFDQKKEKTINECSPIYGSDLELDQVLGENYFKQYDDESLESIMRSRSQVTSVPNRNRQLDLTSPSSISEGNKEKHLNLPFQVRPLSMTHQQRNVYATIMSLEEDSDEKEESKISVLAHLPSLLEQQREHYQLVMMENCKKNENDSRDESHNNNVDNDHDDHDDGSSYSSVCHKISCFKKKNSIVFISSSSNSNSNNTDKSMDKDLTKIATKIDSLEIRPSDSTDTFSTIQTQNYGSYSHIFNNV